MVCLIINAIHVYKFMMKTDELPKENGACQNVSAFIFWLKIIFVHLEAKII